MVERRHHIYGTVKLGERGQVVIPIEARKDLNIKSGEMLIAMTGKNRQALILVKAEAMREFANKIMQGLDVAEEENHKTQERKPDV